MKAGGGSQASPCRQRMLQMLKYILGTENTHTNKS